MNKTTTPLTYSALVAREEMKRAKVTKKGDTYTLVDTQTGDTIGTAEGLIQLEDRINWIDKP